MTESGNWVSCKPQIVHGITYRQGDAYDGAGSDDPYLQPDGMWVWRCAHDRWDGGPQLPFVSSARGHVGWGVSRPVTVEPVIAEHDFLHGTDIIDEQATLALKNKAFERAREEKVPQLTSEQEYARGQAFIRQVRQAKLEEAKAAASEKHIDETEHQAKAAAEMKRRKQAEEQAPEAPEPLSLDKLLQEEERLVESGDAVALEAIRGRIEKAVRA